MPHLPFSFTALPPLPAHVWVLAAEGLRICEHKVALLKLFTCEESLNWKELNK